MKIMTAQRIRRLRYYSKAIAEMVCVPDGIYRSRLKRKLETLSEYDRSAVFDRVNYYNQQTAPFSVTPAAPRLADLPFWRKTMSYYDYRAIMRHFPVELRADLNFEDVHYALPAPTFTKSRPIGESGANCVLLKLRKVRQYHPIIDRIPFEEKKNRLVWRGAAWQPHRKAFLRGHWNHPLYDVGHVGEAREDIPREWIRDRMSIREQLRYKFVLSMHGTDIATNLKWIAQSNSLCFMTKPRVEDWFMEGRLVAGTHYVELRDDYADLPEKVEHYLQHPDEAKAIIANFQAWHRPFTDRGQEELVGLLVALKYFDRSGQFSVPGVFQ